jgi:hypothetical protein
MLRSGVRMAWRGGRRTVVGDGSGVSPEVGLLISGMPVWPAGRPISAAQSKIHCRLSQRHIRTPAQERRTDPSAVPWDCEARRIP